jgi:NADH:ubiquinone oxidoreductase subunit E
MKGIMDEIKFKDNPAHDTSEAEGNNKENRDTIPALMLFQSLRLWEDEAVKLEKIKKVAEILNIDTREIWYILDTDQKTANTVLKLTQSFAKKMGRIRRFSANGQEL